MLLDLLNAFWSAGHISRHSLPEVAEQQKLLTPVSGIAGIYGNHKVSNRSDRTGMARIEKANENRHGTQRLGPLER
jgi:hypothetical protein